MIFILSSCIKDHQAEVVYFNPGKQTYGWATAEIHGSDWEASGQWKYHLSDSTIWILFGTRRYFPGINQDIRIDEIPLKAGRYEVTGAYGRNGDGKIGSKLILRDHDSYGASIPLDLNKENFIQINEINFSAATIKGTFELFYRLEDWPEDGGYDHKNGKFEIRRPR